MSAKMKYEISLDRPMGATARMVKEYILTALTAERGIRHPDEDPMSNFDPSTLKIRFAGMEDE